MTIFNTITNNIISQHQHKPHFSYTAEIIHSSYAGLKFINLHFVFQYCESGIQTYHCLDFDESGEPVFSTGLEFRFIDHLTGQILYEIFGFNNRPIIRSVLTELINAKKPVDIYMKNHDHHSQHAPMKQIKKFGYTSVHQLKSGKWVGEF